MLPTFPYPKAWATARLRSALDSIQYGYTASAVPEKVGPKFLRITDLEGGPLNWSTIPHCICKKPDVYQLASGDLVIARTGATTGKSHLLRDIPEAAVFASYLIRLRCSPTLDAGFLNHFLQSSEYWRQICSQSYGTAQPGANASVLSKLIVPLPELEEQQAIARVLDAVDVAIERTRTAITKAERLKQGLLQGIFEWADVPLEKLGASITEIRYGTSQASNDKAWGCPTLRIPNVIGGTISTDDLTCVDASLREVQRYLLRQGDLLLVRTNGNPSYIGRSAVFQPPDERQWLYASYLIRVRFDDRVLPRYVDEYLKSGRGRRELFRRVTTSAGNYNINTKSIRAIPIHIPEKDEQANVVRIADAANLRIAVLEHQRGKLERLKRGLMQDLLTGRVRLKLPPSSGNGVVRSRT